MRDRYSLIAELKALLGPSGCLSEAADLARYESDFRRLHHGRALAMVRPQTVSEVQAVVRWANTQNLSVVPVGGNTSYCGGATPDDSGWNLVLSLERLKRIRAIDPTSFTLTVEAGCTLNQVHEAAESVHRRFPLTLGSQGSCQIGGNLSTNAGGTSVLRFGMARELVLGLEVVLPDGQLLNQLSTLRKDNTGYDVKQLFIGAEGTLGIITAATLKLFPKPQDYCTALIALPDIACAVKLLGLLRDQYGDCIESFEYIPESAASLVRTHLSLKDPLFSHSRPHTDSITKAPPARVLVEWAIPKAWQTLTDHVAEYLMSLVEDKLLLDVALAQSEQERLHFWETRERIPEAQTLEGASIKHDVALPIHALSEFVTKAERLVLDVIPNARIINYGHVGDGNLHYNLSPPIGTLRHSPEEQHFLSLKSTITHKIHELVKSLEGSFSAEHGIGQLKRGELDRYEDPVALHLMRTIKKTLDPDNRLNPGKVV